MGLNIYFLVMMFLLDPGRNVLREGRYFLRHWYSGEAHRGMGNLGLRNLLS